MKSRICSTVRPLAISSVARGEVDAEEAGMADRRAADAQVDFLGAGTAEREHLAAGGGAADDRVLDDDDALAARRCRG